MCLLVVGDVRELTRYLTFTKKWPNRTDSMQYDKYTWNLTNTRFRWRWIIWNLGLTLCHSNFNCLFFWDVFCIGGLVIVFIYAKWKAYLHPALIFRYACDMVFLLGAWLFIGTYIIVFLQDQFGELVPLAGTWKISIYFVSFTISFSNFLVIICFKAGKSKLLLKTYFTKFAHCCHRLSSCIFLCWL